MKVLLDTNVILDVLLDRQPFSEDGAELMAKIERGELIGYLCATTITTIHYLMKKALGNKQATGYLQILISLFEIAPVNRLVIQNALTNGFRDFEDAVLYESARHVGVDYLITRNTIDFKRSKLPVFDPSEFLIMLQNTQNL